MSQDSESGQQLSTAVRSVRRRLRMLTTAVLLMMLALVLDVFAVFGYVADFDGGRGIRRGSIAAVAALAGFAIGWIIAMIVKRGPRADDAPAADITASLQAIRRRVQRLTLAVLLMTLGLFLNLAHVFGSTLGYHADEPLLYYAAAAGVAVLGVVFGWIARRRY
jgi:hypothetical protein